MLHSKCLTWIFNFHQRVLIRMKCIMNCWKVKLYTAFHKRFKFSWNDFGKEFRPRSPATVEKSKKKNSPQIYWRRERGRQAIVRWSRRQARENCQTICFQYNGSINQNRSYVVTDLKGSAKRQLHGFIHLKRIEAIKSIGFSSQGFSNIPDAKNYRNY